MLGTRLENFRQLVIEILSKLSEYSDSLLCLYKKILDTICRLFL